MLCSAVPSQQHCIEGVSLDLAVNVGVVLAEAGSYKSRLLVLELREPKLN